MSDLTICAKCQHYSAAIHHYNSLIPVDFPAYCWANPSQEVTIDCVTGKQAFAAPVECYDKNHGQCADYAFKPPEPLFKIVQDEPRKHWWNRFDGPPMDVYPDRERKK